MPQDGGARRGDVWARYFERRGLLQLFDEMRSPVARTSALLRSNLRQAAELAAEPWKRCPVGNNFDKIEPSTGFCQLRKGHEGGHHFAASRL